jgi:hypothetical protein
MRFVTRCMSSYGMSFEVLAHISVCGSVGEGEGGGGGSEKVPISRL